MTNLFHKVVFWLYLWALLRTANTRHAGWLAWEMLP